MHMQTALAEQTQTIIGQFHLELFIEDLTNVITQTGNDISISIKEHCCVFIMAFYQVSAVFFLTMFCKTALTCLLILQFVLFIRSLNEHISLTRPLRYLLSLGICCQNHPSVNEMLRNTNAPSS